MSRGNWGIVVALVGWLGLAEAQQANAQTQKQQTAPKVSEPAPPPSLPAPKPVKPIQPPPLERPCEGGNDDRNSDLCAQWKAADAARDAATYTWWGLVIGCIGTLGLFWTLFYTRAAVKAAQAATKDADRALDIADRNAKAALAAAKHGRESNDIARETQLAQLRPYLHASRVDREIAHYLSMDVISDEITWQVWLKNFGQTPAKNARIDARWAIVKSDEWSDAETFGLRTVYLGDVPPQGDAFARFFATGLQAFHETIRSGEHVAVFNATIVYTDGFGRSYSTSVRRYMAGPDYSIDPLLISAQGNEAH